MAVDVMPKNIIMIGSTGVGKTEIARRLARMSNSPFLKVEASKFTEVGYVGRDVESMVRDLVEIAIKMVREEREADVRDKARQAAEERLLDLLLPPGPASPLGEASTDAAMVREQQTSTRERLREQLRAGKLDTKTVELETRERSMPSFELIQGSSIEEIGVPEVPEFLQQIVDSGGHLWACRMSADMQHLEESDLYDEVEGIISASDFIEKTDGAQLLFI